MCKIIHFQDAENKININLEWQKKLDTEYKVYKYIQNNNNLPCSYLAYPWTTIIDLFNHKIKNYNTLYDFVVDLGLSDNLKKRENYITTVQSYHYYKFVKDFQKLNIKYIFSPHIEKNKYFKFFIENNIIFIPFIIYPSNNKRKELKKKYLYSFIGNTKYSLKEPTEIRKKIIRMEHCEKETFIKEINFWHYNKSIYTDQLGIVESNDNNNNIKIREDEYSTIMNQSKFALCPLGIGPNSIRLWESLYYETIPISISNNLWLPYYVDINWNDIIIEVNQENIEDIYKVKSYSELDIEKYQNKIHKFKNEYLLDSNFGNLVTKYFNNDKKFNLLISWFNTNNFKRYNEFYTCLENNIQNDYIKKIFVFYEVSNIDEIKNIHNSNKIKIIPIVTKNKRSISFNIMAKYANENLLNQYCIISNSDIYFDNTLERINELNFHKDDIFISLTRKNCHNYIDYKGNIWKPHSLSQDSWIFLTPLKLMNKEINLGWIQCDNIISNDYHELGYNVINPHYSINAWHLHENNNTLNLLDNYNYKKKYKMMKVDLNTIDTIVLNTNVLNSNVLNTNVLNKRLFFNPSKLNKIKASIRNI